MDIISMVMLGITAYFLFFGLAYGFKRGVVRSIFRLITVGVAFVAAWLGKDICVSAVMDFEIQGFGVRWLIDLVVKEAPSLAGIVEHFVALVVGLLLFVLGFLVLKLVTAIAFGILQIFVPRGKRIPGMVVGLVQGALIAFCVCAPLNGLLVDVAKLSDFDMGEILDTSKVQQVGEAAKTYSDGIVSKLYTEIGDGFYKELSSEVNEDGESNSISTYVDALVSASKFTGVFDTVTNIDMSAGLTEENRDTIHQMFKDLDAIKNDMGKDSMTVVNEIVSAVASDFGAALPESVTTVLENFDFTEANFEQEGEILMDLYDLLENENGEASAADIVNALAESTVVLPVIEGVLAEENASLSLPDEATKAEVSAAIAGVADPAVRDQLMNLFGLAA